MTQYQGKVQSYVLEIQSPNSPYNQKGVISLHGLSDWRFSISCRRMVCVPKTLSVLIGGKNHLTSAHMIALLYFVLTVLISPFKSKSRLEADNAALRYQLSKVASTRFCLSVYRKPKPGRSGDEVRQGLGVN
jgi:hypothetical protein